jgi:hypothetical protein
LPGKGVSEAELADMFKPQMSNPRSATSANLDADFLKHIDRELSWPSPQPSEPSPPPSEPELLGPEPDELASQEMRGLQPEHDA